MTTLEILILILVITQTILILGLLIAVFYIIRILRVLAEHVGPESKKIQSTLESVNQTVSKISSRVDHTTVFLQKTVQASAIDLSAWICGARQLTKIFTRHDK